MARTPTQLEKQLRAALQVSAEQESIRQIAESIGITHGQLSRFIRGERDLRLATAGQLAEYLALELVSKRKNAK